MNTVADIKTNKPALILILVLAGVFLAVYFSNRETDEPASQTPTTTNTTFTQPVDNYRVFPNDVLPPGMPQDMPIIDASDTPQNTAYESGGISYSVTRYHSSLSIEQLHSRYIAYLQKKGWTTRTEVDKTDDKTISASKTADSVLNVIINRDKGGILVSIFMIGQLLAN